jgi:hypothetical protein
MSVRVGTGWQTIIADLSMILFMLTASAVAHQGSRTSPPPVSPPPASAVTSKPAPLQPTARGEPVAVWIAGEGAPPLREWLAQQPRDSRQQVTITATYAPGAMAQAMAQAQALALQAGDARVVVEPGPASVRVEIGYDAPEARLAHDLRREADAIKSKDRS